MTNRKHELEQMLEAALGLGPSASASALRNVSELAGKDGTQPTLEQIAILTSLSERAQTCMTVAAQAEAEGDVKLAELGWLQALSLMNHMAEESVGQETPASQEEHFSSRKVAGRLH